ncbi:glycosyltransferase [Oscillatoria sp. CS-180]|uniref:glycosyltransferase n=1 Tax=Oscillatoria sp. CS-180 TaxID=3021720 RepID=UPI002330E89E|nr:glycosyltransferase [Oscillatoria sp. CS-180]MDB9526754.1 glycosyltransferase [Oscillatoria sp. CS-180]
MKIAIIAHSHYPISEPFAGGLEAHTFHLTKQLQLSGHKVTLFAASGSDQTLPIVPFLEPTAVEHFSPKHQIVEYRENRYSALMDFLKHSDFDVVHNNSLHYVPLERVNELPMPMVTVLHTPPFPSLVSGFRAGMKARNHFVISVSKSVAHDWQNKLPQLKTTLIYNGVDTRYWLPFGLPRKQAIWVGRITPEKGTHWAIKAASLANIHLNICGPIHDADYFNQQVKPRLNKQTVYLGCLDAHTLAREVAQASVLLCTPCWDEPFGLVVAEALASGTPIAGFDRGALAEVLTPETGVLVQECVTSLAIAITKAQRLCRHACRRRAIRLFSLDTMVQRYVELYQTLAAKSARRFTATAAL